MIRIAVPVLGEAFCAHFGRCDGFWLGDVQENSRAIERPRRLPRPRQRCESTPQWLKSLGVTVVAAGGIGAVARHRLTQIGIAVSECHTQPTPEQVAQAWLLTPNHENPNPCPSFEHRHHHCKQ